MNAWRVAGVRWTAGLLVPLALSLAVPALAAGSLTTQDGTVIRVWRAVALAGPGDTGGRSVLAYSVAGGSGTTVGIVDALDRGAVGEDAALALDPATGSPVVVWSRHDGSAFRIAYARLEAGIWTDIHDLTFGAGDASHPRIGTGRTGAWLFWIVDGKQYLYAPFELSSGRLFAAPRPLFTDRSPGAPQKGPVRPDADWLQLGGTSGDGSTCGGQDCPVVLPSSHGRGGTKGSIPLPPVDPRPRPKTASDLTMRGSIDAPVILGLTVWQVVSSPDCRSLILVVSDGSDVTLLRFRDGTVNRLGRGRTPAAPPSGDFATTLASTSLQFHCD